MATDKPEALTNTASRLLGLIDKLKKQRCTLGAAVVGKIDEESARALDAVLKSDVSTAGIHRILREDGYIIGRHLLGESRKCYLRNENCECRKVLVSE
jgi:hypothetical protein